MPNLKSAEAPFTLRQCLFESVQSGLSACDDNLEDMLSRLDEKYANPSKLVDCVVFEIQKFRKIDLDDNRRIIAFVDVIDRGYRDLKKLNLEQELCNSHVLGIIECKLPKNLQSEWYRMIHKEKIKISEKFVKLLDFLKIERSALEYGMSELRAYYERKPGHIHSLQGASSHSLSDTCLIHNEAHRTENCKTYLTMTISDRYELLKRYFACFCCLTPDHRVEFCPQKRECGGGCSKFHHPSLHPPFHQAANNCCSVKNTCLENHDTNVILPIMKINYKNDKFINVLWDTAANLSLITKQKARDMKLHGKPVELSITVAGGERKKIDSEIYNVPIIDENGNKKHVLAYGIDKITNKISSFDGSKIIKLFPEIGIESISRPSGEVDLLIGYEYAGWHPTKELSHGHLLILRNQFGRCFGGNHPSIQEGTQRVVNNASVVNLIYKAGVSSDFFTLESMGTHCEPLCGGCKCGKCPIGGKPYTIKEERELRQIEDGLSFHGTYWEAKYPWLKSPDLLPDNYSFALKILITTENRLKRDLEWQKKYCDQVTDMISRNVARKLDPEELANYKGPIHYIAHHAVVKPDSKSTPVRIVFNSSANFNGHVLNDYWVKGPDAFMNNLLGVLLRFRENHVGIAGDIRKMYNSVRTCLLDQHCHRFLWRDMDTFRAPDVYVITAVNIGDRPSGTIATVALHKTADLKKLEYPKEVDIIKGSSYVDDIVDSVSSYTEAKHITENIDTILKVGNFHIKSWTISDSSSEHDEKTLLHDSNERVLGVYWDPRTDKLKFNVKINFSKKIKGVHSEPDLLPSDIPERLPILTKRLILSQVNGIYDPLGLISPFIVKAKILLRKLWAYEPQLEWDDKVPQNLLNEWIDFFRQSFTLSSLVFNRCVKPMDAVGEPVLVSFSDASKEAFGTCIYLRWKLSNNSYESNLLISKGRVAPLRVVTIVRLELNAAVLACRLRKFVEKECRVSFSRSIHIVDSEIVRSMIQKESYGFNTHTSTKIGEIQEATDKKEWFWIDGKLNIADIMTRGANPNELGLHSQWQKGPEFMKLPVEEWPIRNESLTVNLSERIKTVVAAIKEDQPLIDISRFSDYDKLIRTTARILSVKRKSPKHSLINIVDEVSSQAFDVAELYWVAEAQKVVSVDLKLAVQGEGKYKRLSLKTRDDGIYVVGKRIEAWNEMSYNSSSIPILPKEHRISRLYAESIHNSGHLGVSSDVAKIRTKFWIVAVESIVRSIRFHCVPCRKRDKQRASQIMSPLPQERLKPAPVWSSTGVDLFGPFQIRGEVNKRSTGKCYGVIFTCLLVRAIHLELAVDYSTDGFLMAFRRFTAIRGFPNKMYSDGGTQLVGASSELKTVFKNLDWKRIKAFGANKILEWIFSPGDSPWYNGCCEGLIRSVKKSIHHAVGEHKLSYSELHTVMFEVSSLVNERPIGKKPTEPEEGCYLSPNDLLLGRSSGKLPYQQYDETTNHKRRYAFVQQLVDVYWKKWTIFYLPTLIIQPKWHHEKRNMMVGDIVLIQDSNNLRGQWKLGRVSQTYPGVDSKVRRVTVQYMLPNHHTFTNIERSVQRLVLIVPADESSTS